MWQPEAHWERLPSGMGASTLGVWRDGKLIAHYGGMGTDIVDFGGYALSSVNANLSTGAISGGGAGWLAAIAGYMLALNISILSPANFEPILTAYGYVIVILGPRVL